jgi:hypothetical protein
MQSFELFFMVYFMIFQTQKNSCRAMAQQELFLALPWVTGECSPWAHHFSTVAQGRLASLL